MTVGEAEAPSRPAPRHTGGCQCGAVRYALYAEPFDVHVCHCRMCQKAVGNAFAALAGVKVGELAWTRGRPSTFMSSSDAERGFCAACGTPLTFRYPATPRVFVTLGSLDHAERLRLEVEYGIESRVGWLDGLGHVPALTTGEDAVAEPIVRLERMVRYQHPDHDTPNGWAPPAPRRDG